jgi:hypothetical protein
MYRGATYGSLLGRSTTINSTADSNKDDGSPAVVVLTVSVAAARLPLPLADDFAEAPRAFFFLAIGVLLLGPSSVTAAAPL